MNWFYKIGPHEKPGLVIEVFKMYIQHWTNDDPQDRFFLIQQLYLLVFNHPCCEKH